MPENYFMQSVREKRKRIQEQKNLRNTIIVMSAVFGWLLGMATQAWLGEFLRKKAITAAQTMFPW